MTDPFEVQAAAARARAAEHAAWRQTRAREATARAVQLFPRDFDGADVFAHWQALVERGMFGGRPGGG